MEPLSESLRRSLIGHVDEVRSWYIVPADDKWYTRYVVAQIVLKELKAINPKFPKLSPEVEKQLARFRQLLKEVDIKDLKSIKNAIDEQKVK